MSHCRHNLSFCLQLSDIIGFDAKHHVYLDGHMAANINFYSQGIAHHKYAIIDKSMVPYVYNDLLVFWWCKVWFFVFATDSYTKLQLHFSPNFSHLLYNWLNIPPKTDKFGYKSASHCRDGGALSLVSMHSITGPIF